MSQGREEINGFGSDAQLLIARHRIERAHIVEAVGELYQNHAHVFGKRHQHLAIIFRLRRGAVFKYAANFGKPVDDSGDFFPKDAFQIVERNGGGFHHIMEEGGDNCRGAEAYFFYANFGHRQRMKNEGIAAFSPHVFVSFGRHGKGFFYQSGIALFKDGFRFSQKAAVAIYDFAFLNFRINHPDHITCSMSSHFHCAITVRPPRVLSPNFTFTLASKGKNISTLEPNFIKPNSSPCSNGSPSFTYQRMRRAREPAICRKRISSPFSVFAAIVVRSLSVLDFGCQATRYSPG